MVYNATTAATVLGAAAFGTDVSTGASPMPTAKLMARMW